MMRMIAIFIVITTIKDAITSHYNHKFNNIGDGQERVRDNTENT